MLLFFVIIVVIPMVAVALVLTRLIGESEVGRADSQLAEGLQVAIGVYEESQRGAITDLRDFSRQESVRQAFVGERSDALLQAAQAEVRRDPAVESIVLYGDDGKRLGRAGEPSALAFAT